MGRMGRKSRGFGEDAVFRGSEGEERRYADASCGAGDRRRGGAREVIGSELGGSEKRRQTSDAGNGPFGRESMGPKQSGSQSGFREPE